jgi:predicted deacylase
VLRGITVLLAVIMISLPAAIAFKKQWVPDTFVRGPGVTRTGTLSEYFDGLRGTVQEVPYYLLEGSEKGGTIVLWGGTHPVEPAGVLASDLLIENARLTQGRIFVIPQANFNGYTNTKIGMGDIDRYRIPTDFGHRTFRLGGRGTNPVCQWPDPDVYTNAVTGQSLAGEESRNLNRTHPGTPHGYLTEKGSFALLELIRKEKADIAIDLHEAPPDRPLVNAMAVHERAKALASVAILNLELQGIKMRLEISPKHLRGLSHREIGDYTQALAVLMETQSPYHGPLRGRSDEKSLLTAKDEFLVLASRMGRTSVKHPPEGVPIDVRVARHVASIIALADAFTELYPDKPIKIEGMPSYEEMVRNGIGHYMREVK